MSIVALKKIYIEKDEESEKYYNGAYGYLYLFILKNNKDQKFTQLSKFFVSIPLKGSNRDIYNYFNKRNELIQLQGEGSLQEAIDTAKKGKIEAGRLRIEEYRRQQEENKKPRTSIFEKYKNTDENKGL